MWSLRSGRLRVSGRLCWLLLLRGQRWLCREWLSPVPRLLSFSTCFSKKTLPEESLYHSTDLNRQKDWMRLREISEACARNIPSTCFSGYSLSWTVRGYGWVYVWEQLRRVCRVPGVAKVLV